MGPRLRVAALLRWHGRILLCRQEKPGKEYWLLPGGGAEAGESLLAGLRRELEEEIGLAGELVFEGPIAIAESMPPQWTPQDRHVVHVIFATDLSHRSLEDVEPHDAVVRGTRLFALDDLDDIVVHPPIKRFLQRWQPGDPAVYLGSLWAR
ncbi:MAG: NUDIX hydrolase [Actinobacteria bacterium]|nr:NUDIX hydrolase [Actinomycetota bacterium]MBV8394818.1 NUDIX hydrolase [Actinomycetota bacterium]MBV8598299.1 NUDIX hydrolase [Actinomycetota bacterium]